MYFSFENIHGKAHYTHIKIGCENLQQYLIILRASSNKTIQGITI